MKWLLPIILLCGIARANVITAASCSSTDVQSAFTSATNATTQINIPSCSGGTGWSTQVTFTVPSGTTTVSIIGAGSLTTTGGGDQTVIVDNYSNSNPLLKIDTGSSTSVFVRLAGITFKGGSTGTGNDKFTGIVQIVGSTTRLRVDHSHIDTSTYSPSANGSGIQFNGCLSGVTDHSIFDAGSGTVNNMLRFYNSGNCNSDALGVGDQSWTIATGLGSSNFMFAEDNVINNGAGNDCTQGGRFVWRHNTTNATTPAPSVQTHPTGGGGRERGCRAWEVYDNTFVATSGNYINAGFFVSSGTGVIWGNSTNSSAAGGGTGYGNLVTGHVMRYDNSTYTQTATPNGWGYCGTHQNGTPSNWDQNSDAPTGYACIDQLGRGAGQLLVNDFPTTVNNSTGTIAWPNQSLEPIYEWADAYSPVPSNPSHIWSENDPPAVQNRDYYLGTADSGSPITFNGTAGVGAGLLASRPGTCTPLVAYWATDTTTLYQCSSTNTWTTYYQPYTYPHPLIGITVSSVVAGGAKLGGGATIQ